MDPANQTVAYDKYKTFPAAPPFIDLVNRNGQEQVSSPSKGCT